MSVSVDNITTLKTVSADSNKLRFVESERAWFWSDPASSETADNVVIVAPNAGIGRWYKAYSRETTPSGWTWTLVTSAPTTVTANNRSAYMCNASSTNTITITLPSSPSLGDTVRIRKIDASGYNRRVIVDRNSNKINGLTSNISFSRQYTDAKLIYVDSTVGWTVDSNYDYTTQTASATTLTYVSDGDTNGVIYYIGTAKNTVSFANPTPSKVNVFAMVNGTLTAMTNNTQMTDRLNNQAYSLNLYDSRIFLRLNVDTPRYLRMSKVSFRCENTVAAAYRGFNVYGMNTSDIPDLSQGYRYYKAPAYLLASFSGDVTMAATTGAWGTYTVDAAQFYDMFYFQFTEPQANGDTSYWRGGEIEVYGDLIW